MTNKLPPGRAEDRRQSGFAADNERRKRFVLGGATQSGTMANAAMKSAAASNVGVASGKMGPTSTQRGATGTTRTGTTNTKMGSNNVSSPLGGKGGGGSGYNGTSSNTSGSRDNGTRAPAGYNASVLGGGGGGGSGYNGSNTSGSRDNGTRAPAGYNASVLGGGGGGGGSSYNGSAAQRGNQTGVGGPGGGGMGLDNARRGSSTTSVGPKSGSEAPGNIGRGVGGGTSPAMAALQDRVESRELAKNLRSASLLDTSDKPRAPTVGRSAVVPTYQPQMPSAQRLAQQYRSPVTMSNDAVVPGYNNSYENRQNSVNALRDTMDALSGTPNNPYTKNMDRTIRTLAGEAGLKADNVTPRASVGDVANVMVNRAMVSNIKGLDQFNNDLTNPVQWEAYKTDAYKQANPGSVIAQNVAEAALKGLMDGPVVPNATGFRSSATTLKDGVNVGGNVFGNFANISDDQMSSIRDARMANMASMDTGVNAPTGVANAAKQINDRLVTVNGNTFSVSPEQMARLTPGDQQRIAEANQRVSYTPGVATDPRVDMRPGSYPAQPTSVSDVFADVGRGLGSLFGDPTPAEAGVKMDTPLGPYTNKQFHDRISPTLVNDPVRQSALDRMAMEDNSYYVGGAPNERMLYNASPATLDRMNAVFDANTPTPPSGTDTQWGGRRMAAAVPGVAGTAFTGIPGTTQPGLYDQVDPFSPGDRGIGRTVNPYSPSTAKQFTDRVPGDSALPPGVSGFGGVSDGLALPGQSPYSNIADKTDFIDKGARLGNIGGMSFNGMPGQMDAPRNPIGGMSFNGYPDSIPAPRALDPRAGMQATLENYNLTRGANSIFADETLSYQPTTPGMMAPRQSINGMVGGAGVFGVFGPKNNAQIDYSHPDALSYRSEIYGPSVPDPYRDREGVSGGTLVNPDFFDSGYFDGAARANMQATLEGRENVLKVEDHAVQGDPRENMQSTLEAYRSVTNPGVPYGFNDSIGPVLASRWGEFDEVANANAKKALGNMVGFGSVDYGTLGPGDDGMMAMYSPVETAPPITTNVDVPDQPEETPVNDGPFTNPQLVDPHAPSVKYPRQAIKTLGNLLLPGAGWLADKVIGWDMDRINQMTPEQQAEIMARWKRENELYRQGGTSNGNGGNAYVPYIPPGYYDAFPSAIGAGGGGDPSRDDDGNPGTNPATDVPPGYNRRRLGMPDPYTYGYSPEYSYFTYV